MKAVKTHNADFAVVVDPDVDRLVLITDKGEPFGEENTITLAADFVLNKTKGNVVVNLSTSRSVEDVAKKIIAKHFVHQLVKLMLYKNERSWCSNWW